MIAILSPAKNMKPFPSPLESSTPLFLPQAAILCKEIKRYHPWELESMMKINQELAIKAHMNFQHFKADASGSISLLSYDGLVFKYLQPQSFSHRQLRYANDHLRILSGFYGILRPLDNILPYRLEMQTKVTIQGKNLYQYWGNRLYNALYSSQPSSSPKPTSLPRIVINLASQEYAKCITPYLKPQDQFIQVDFLSFQKGKLRTLATLAKMARGKMARFIVEEKIQKPQKLQNFDWEGYQFAPQLSTSHKYTFIKS